MPYLPQEANVRSRPVAPRRVNSAMKTLTSAVLSAMAFLSPVAFAGDSFHYEMRARAYIDGSLYNEARLSKLDYPTLESCIKDAMMVGPVPPSQVVDGHNVSFSITCIKVSHGS